MSNWIKIEDRKPPNDVYVIVASFYGRKNVKMYSIKIACRMNTQWVDDHNQEVLDPKYGIITHWMPLPDQPEIL